MLQDKAETNANEDRFFQRVLDSGTAWMLNTPQGGIAYCEYHETEFSVFLFWSDRAYANRQRKDGWEQYNAAKVPVEHLARMFSKMADNGVLVGLNWDANLCGNEACPADAVTRLGYSVAPPDGPTDQTAHPNDDSFGTTTIDA